MHIGFISSSPQYSTGYGKVVRNLSVQLRKLYSTKVSFCDVGSSGVPIETEYGRVYPGAEVTGMYRYIRTERPDVIIHVRDNWVFTPKFFQTPYDIYDLCRRVGSKLVLYSPVHSMIPPEVADVAKNRCDYQITMSKWGAQIYSIYGVDKVEYVYQGVDTTIYNPKDKNEMKKKYGFDPAKPLISYVAMNIDYRKMLPLALTVYRLLLNEGVDAQLFLGTEPIFYWDLDVWERALGLLGMVYYPRFTSKNWGIPEEDYANILGASDVYLSVSTAEGFCLPVLEASASGIPCVVTDHPIFHELYRDDVYYISGNPYYPTSWGSFEVLIDPTNAVEQVIKALDEKKNAKGKAVTYTWESAAQKLHDIIVNGMGISF